MRLMQMNGLCCDAIGEKAYESESGVATLAFLLATQLIMRRHHSPSLANSCTLRSSSPPLKRRATPTLPQEASCTAGANHHAPRPCHRSTRTCQFGATLLWDSVVVVVLIDLSRRGCHHRCRLRRHGTVLRRPVSPWCHLRASSTCTGESLDLGEFHTRTHTHTRARACI